jgi:hypothetical protein
MKLLINTLEGDAQEWLRPKQVSALHILMHYFLLRDAKLELLTPYSATCKITLSLLAF